MLSKHKLSVEDSTTRDIEEGEGVSVPGMDSWLLVTLARRSSVDEVFMYCGELPLSRSVQKTDATGGQ